MKSEAEDGDVMTAAEKSLLVVHRPVLPKGEAEKPSLIYWTVQINTL